MRYLGVCLYAPLAAHGALAVGGQRASWDRPGRSAILGLVAAALGIDRQDAATLASLDAGYGLALRQDALGQELTDYHTVQHPKGMGLTFATQREAITYDTQGTIITTREYRADSLHLVVLWERDGAPHNLEILKAALQAPCYAPYLGRKGCPLGLPLGPVTVEAETPVEALQRRQDSASLPEIQVRHWLRASPGQVFLDAEDAAAFRLDVARIEYRRDRLIGGRIRQYSLRGEAVLRMMGDIS